MDIDINTIESGPSRALLFFDTLSEALHEDWVSSLDRVNFYYYIRRYKEAREQQLPREPDKQYQILLQLQASSGFTIESGLADLKPGSKVLVTITNRTLFTESYNESILKKQMLLDRADPYKRAASNQKLYDYIENEDKKASQLKLYFGNDPRAFYRGKDKSLKHGSKQYAILEYLSKNKNTELYVNEIKKVVNQEITNGHLIDDYADVDDAIRSLKIQLKINKDDFFPIVGDGYRKTITWSDHK